ncbi:tRNA (guanine-N(7)-)-methyltransferase non-catalytic subunit wuho-like isoform X2 [Littorina saxatilis]|uniref:tRNA (guanine-N(7)-)-methyltransferase non-catalytic subunit wuho-like isoform X2 n=1 Tax=Littorina saxatilis TaxID=31220 RepID=UPI0038B4AAC3
MAQHASKMAAIRTYGGTLAMTSGNCVAVSNIREPNLFQTFNIPSLNADKPDKKDDEDRLLARRATSLTFTLDESTVVVADKSGDVYSFPTVTEVKDDDTPEVKTLGQLLLGHLSMVLDVCLADREQYVVTCDRDEKIRLSCFPNAYNIHSYCLGHTQFVSCLKYVEEFRVLVSGSGDCSVRVWNMEGKQLCQAECPVNRSSDAVTSPQLSSANRQQSDEHGDGDKNGNDKEEKFSNKVAIQGLTYCKQCRLLVVSFYSHPELLVYRLGINEEKASLDHIQTIPIQVTPWDVTFDDSNNVLWVLAPVEGTTVSAFKIMSADESGEDADKVQLVKVQDDGSQVSEVLKTVNSKWDFFSDSLSVPSNIPSLWKVRSQDQVTQYQERKHQRIQGGKARQGNKGKKDRQGHKDQKERQDPKDPKDRQGQKDKSGNKADMDGSVSQQSTEDLPEKKPRVL